jgi:DNA adenine methylase
MVSRPVMRYPGGKFALAPWIISHFPQHGFYVEPFGGGASVLMRKPKISGEIFNDLESEVVNVFRVLRNKACAHELEHLIKLTPFSYEEYRDAYEPSDDPIERARRMIFRSYASIGSDGVHRRNAGFRGIKSYQARVTAAKEWASYPAAIQTFLDRLNGVLIENRHAMELFRMYDRPETLWYLDPPYLMSTRSKNSVLYSKEMTEQQHIELAEAIHQLKGMVVLSGYPSPLYDDLYKGWQTASKSAKANIGGKRIECIWLSPNIKTRLF